LLKVMHIVGARPNFPKVAPIMAEMAKQPDRFAQLLVHTGQHYDYNMSQVFFEHLDMSAPTEFLNVGSGSHAVQTAGVMTAFEPVLLKHRPDWVIVVGDVNSTLACALVCSKLGVRVAHVEAGLRSRDRSMPEEINRLMTDQICDLLFTSSREGDENLIREGVGPEKIHFVGNVMIDTLVKMLPKALQRPTLSNLGLKPRQYILVTLHRPSNVDDPQVLRGLLEALAELSRQTEVIFPVHPRTRSRIEGLGMQLPNTTLNLLDPLGYLDFLAVMNGAGLVVTDSGGVQEETTFLGVPCLTARPNTERPITITEGTNRLTNSRCDDLVQGARELLHGSGYTPRRLEMWDGQAAKRIVTTMLNL
jgi:UDP-N-acetylglucosamine 2-epimerase (non-hydrolysing)